MNVAAAQGVRSAGRQTATGLMLAVLIGAAWLGLHVHGVFFHRLTGFGIAAAPLIVLALTWLNVGLFIVAHDCMHGSLAPGRPRINRTVGRVMLGLYAGFSYDRLLPKHHGHHRHAGTPRDPDFSSSNRFWPWYLSFVREYFGWREFGVLTVLLAAYVFILGAEPANALLFWALPAILSSLQLFLFGTYLPHRRGGVEFGDRHRTRSNDYGYLASLISCYHFGYHHEHHRSPATPWWALPRLRAMLRSDRRPG